MRFRIFGIEFHYRQVSLASLTTPAELVEQHEQAVADHEAKLKDLRTTAKAKGAEIGQALAALQADLSVVKALETRLG